MCTCFVLFSHEAVAKEWEFVSSALHFSYLYGHVWASFLVLSFLFSLSPSRMIRHEAKFPFRTHEYAYGVFPCVLFSQRTLVSGDYLGEG